MHSNCQEAFGLVWGAGLVSVAGAGGMHAHVILLLVVSLFASDVSEEVHLYHAVMKSDSKRI
jgi:hypothetical protein